MDYSEEAKKTSLNCQGWESDHPGLYNSISNGGWLKRRAKFIKYERKLGSEIGTEQQEFRSDPVSFVGKLRTNWENLQQGLVPNTSFTVTLLFTHPDFAVWSPPVGTSSHPTQEFKLQVDSCELYVPVAQLNLTINNHLQQAMNHKAAVYFFRELRCQTYPINKGTRIFVSTDLRAPNQAAIKIYFGIVKRSAYKGNQHENP